MGWTANLNNLKESKVFTYLFMALALIIPGAGYIYLTDIKLFLKIDILKLLILSMIYSTPLFFEGFVYSLFCHIKSTNKEDGFRFIINISSIFAILIFLLSVASVYLSKYPEEPIYFIVQGCLIGFIALIVRVIQNIKNKNKKKKLR